MTPTRTQFASENAPPPPEKEAVPTPNPRSSQFSLPVDSDTNEIPAGSLPDIIRALVIQKDDDHFQQLRHLLPPTHSCDFEFQQAKTFQTASERVDSDTWDILFVDISLGCERTGDVLEKIVNFAERFPIIVLTPMEEEHRAREAIRKGAQDYIIYEAAAPQLLHRTIWAAIDRFNLNQELIEKTKQVERAFWQKHQFLNTLSHEIKTPINGIRGGMQFLREDSENPEQLESIDMIEGAIDQLMILIDNLLEHGKAESGKVQILRKPTPAESLLETLKCTFHMACEVKGLHLHFNLSNDLPDPLMIDELRLRQTLSNLIGNAIKFTQAGSVEVGIEPKGDDMLYFYVKDTGRGISQEKQESIFLPYDQGDDASETQMQGTGLGLAICKEYAEAMGGEIHVKSDLGKGSTFGFTVSTRN